MFIRATSDLTIVMKDNSLEKNHSVMQMAGWYVHSPELQGVRDYCYAFMGHGEPGSMEGTHVNDLVRTFKQAYSANGGNRIVLLLSCAFGYGAARPVARALEAYVVAAQTTVVMSSSGQISLRKETDVHFVGSDKSVRMPALKGNWIYVKPDGTMMVDSVCDLTLENADEFFRS